MATLNQIRKARATNEKDWINKDPAITGVDIGHKFINGNRTDVLAIRVFVEKKTPKKDEKDRKELEQAEKLIRKEIRVDKSVVKTDVIERKFERLPKAQEDSDDEDSSEMTDKKLRAGVRIGNGTLGAIVKKRGTEGKHDLVLMTSSHVVGEDSDIPFISLSQEKRRIKARKNGRSKEAESTFVELEGVETEYKHTSEILNIGPITGTSPGVRGMQVRKRGVQTKLTYGTIETDDLTVHIDDFRFRASELLEADLHQGNPKGLREEFEKHGISFSPKQGEIEIVRVGKAKKWRIKANEKTYIAENKNGELKVYERTTFENQIGIVADLTRNQRFCGAGDSGAVVVNNAQEAVGLLFACDESGTYAAANPIQAVLDDLDVDIYVAEDEGLEGLDKDIDDSMREITSLTILANLGPSVARVAALSWIDDCPPGCGCGGSGGGGG